MSSAIFTNPAPTNLLTLRLIIKKANALKKQTDLLCFEWAIQIKDGFVYLSVLY